MQIALQKLKHLLYLQPDGLLKYFGLFPAAHRCFLRQPYLQSLVTVHQASHLCEKASFIALQQWCQMSPSICWIERAKSTKGVDKAVLILAWMKRRQNLEVNIFAVSQLTGMRPVLQRYLAILSKLKTFRNACAIFRYVMGLDLQYGPCNMP